jgi:hypothetical protein
MRRVLRQAYVIAQLKIVLRKIQIEKGHKLDNLSSRENSDEDLQEARKTWKMGKQFTQNWRIKFIKVYLTHEAQEKDYPKRYKSLFFELLFIQDFVFLGFFYNVSWSFC